MDSKSPGDKPARSAAKTGRNAAQTREDRLKAALKANMGRRKAQARARAAQGPAGGAGKDEQ